MLNILAATDQQPLTARANRAFTGALPDPVLGGLYRYDEIRDAPPSIGPAQRPAHTDHEMAAPMADWIARTPHQRPFWRDPDFIAEFGRATRVELRAAVDELHRRAGDAARVARMPIAWPANLPTYNDAGLEPNERI